MSSLCFFVHTLSIVLCSMYAYRLKGSSSSTLTGFLDYFFVGALGAAAFWGCSKTSTFSFFSEIVSAAIPAFVYILLSGLLDSTYSNAKLLLIIYMKTMCFNLFDEKNGMPILFAAGIGAVTFAFATYKQLDIGTKDTLTKHIRGILMLDILEMVSSWRSKELDVNKMLLTDKEKIHLRAIRDKLKFDTSQPYFLIRSVQRVAFVPIISIILARAVVQMGIHFRHRLFTFILSLVAANNSNSSETFLLRPLLLLLVWAALHLLNMLENYIDRYQKHFVKAIGSVVSSKLVELYIATNNEKVSFLDIRFACANYVYGFESSLNSVITMLGMLAFQMFNTYQIVSRFGWMALIPVVFCILRGFLSQKIKHEIEEYKKKTISMRQPRFYKNFDFIIKNMRACRLFSLESVILKKFLDSENEPIPPIFLTIADVFMTLLNIAETHIVTVVAFSLSLQRVEKILYPDLMVAMFSINSLIQFTRFICKLPNYLYSIKVLEKSVLRLVTNGKNRYITRNMASNDNVAIEMTNCAFAWCSNNFSLNPITLSVKRGEFVTILGKVGGGKSSFLSAICGEMLLVSGHGCVNGTIGYVSQRPWIMNATFRENVLLRSKYDRDLYRSVISACALDQDLEQLPAGDKTEIGSRGVNISGGQKVRLALARALYMQADIYVLDDILSAVDAHVERKLIENLFLDNGFLKDKTCLLVTHANHVVPLSDRVLRIENGTLDVVSQKIIIPDKKANEESKSFNSDDMPVSPGPGLAEYDEKSKFSYSPELEVPVFKKSMLLRYILQSGYMTLILCLSTQILSAYILYYIENRRIVLIMENSAKMDVSTLQSQLALDALLLIARNQIGNVQQWLRINVWSRKLYLKTKHDLLNTFLHCSLTTFERLSSTALETVFQYDARDASNVVPLKINHMAYSAVLALYKLAQVLYIAPLVLIPAFVLFFLLHRVYKQQVNIKSNIACYLSRRGPEDPTMLINEVIEGNSSVRIHGIADRFNLDILYKHAILAFGVEHYNLAESIKGYIDCLAEDILKLAVLFYASCKCLLSPCKLGPGDIDVMVSLTSEAFKLFPALNFENHGLEFMYPRLSRIFAYTDKLKPDAPQSIQENNPPANWPQRGCIEFKDVTMRYRKEIEDTLHGITFSSQSNEKIGIVGRTGAGKSSLAYALMRIIEPQSGSIYIDDVDIASVGISDLRSKISIIPQDPFLFEGTIRENLDPRQVHSDQEVWDAVKKACIENLLEAPTETITLTADSNNIKTEDYNGPWLAGTGLNKWVYPDGRNFSVGQRQLISLCRALLWRRPILILDEATANVDSMTDQIMQKIIRTEFKNNTVLTVAHRLNTVLDSDRILVIDAGKVAEFDTPNKLLARKDSIFAKLVESMRFNNQATNG